MAGDWIKLEKSTPDKPEISLIAEELGIDPDASLGKTIRVLCWFDEHTEKGNAPIVSKSVLDRITGVTGFCDAVIKSGWMIQDKDEIHLVNFDRHNGKTAKNRALTAKRVANHKAKNKEKGNEKLTQGALPREEEEEDKKNSLPVRFAKLISPDYKPSKYVLETVKSAGSKTNPLDPQILTKFISYHLDKGTVSNNWCAAYVKWVLQERVSNNRKPRKPSGEEISAREQAEHDLNEAGNGEYIPGYKKSSAQIFNEGIESALIIEDSTD